MPAPGDQHNFGANPFEEPKARISEYTAQEIATLQSRLEKQLGPEYISSRSGPSGQKVHYVAAEKCIALANEVFGFNGWSSSIQNIQVDFVDENPQTMKISLGLSVVVRVTLRDGTFHEDIGYGHIENCKGKAAAFEKSKKEGTTDALKRALRSFGNVLGNCIYDKSYLAKVTKLKVRPCKFDEEALHRHGDYVKKEEVPAPVETDLVPESFDEFMEDFDEADFCISQEGHPDEVILPNPADTTTNSSTDKSQNGSDKPLNAPPNAHPARPLGRSASAGSLNGAQQHHTPQTPNLGPPRPAQAGPNISSVPNKSLPPHASRPPNKPAAPSALPHPPVNGAAVGSVAFLSARAVSQMPEGGSSGPLPTPQGQALFNPKAESPSIRKTPGIDHSSSKPIPKNFQQPQSAGNQQTTGTTTAPPVPAGNTSFTPVRPQGGPQAGRGNVVNPQLDHMRRIGAPGAPGSPLANRASYRPPTMKRPMPADGPPAGPGRPPLAEVSSNGTVVAPMGAGQDAKRLKTG